MQYSFISQPFVFPETNEESKIKEEEDDLLNYYCDLNVNSLLQIDSINLIPNNELIPISCWPKADPNLLQKEEDNKNRTPNLIFSTTKKKRGRKQEKKGKTRTLKTHNKFTSDNLLRKIQVHYLTFIIYFMNDFLYKLGYNERFYKFDYEFKKNVKKEFVESLKSQNIGEIISSFPISSKYRISKDKTINENENIVLQFKKNKILNQLFSQNYLQLFKKIYYKNNKCINLKEFGLNEKIILSNKVKMYQDLVKNFDKGYKDKLNKCVKEKFLKKDYPFKIY